MNKQTVIGCIITIISLTSGTAVAQKDHPLESRITGTVTLENWQQTRAYGLRNFEKITRDLICANAEHIPELKVERDYEINKLPKLKELTEHDAVDSIVILKGNKIVFERYANGVTPKSQHIA